MANFINQVPGCHVESKIDVQRGKTRFEQVGKFGNTKAKVRAYLVGQGYTVYSITFVQAEETEKPATYRWYTVRKEEPEENDRGADYLLLDCSSWARRSSGRPAGLYTVTFIH